jgi:hypothetical protein
VAAGLAGAKTMIPAVGENSVQQVHGWHCRKRYGWYRGHKYWHRHWRACEDDDYSYYNPYAFYGAPFFFYFDDDDGHKRRRHKHRRYKKKHDYDD